MPNSPAWIICESTGRWTAALRIALTRRVAAAGQSRIFEVRNLADLADAADEAPSALVLIEVRPVSLNTSLNWFFQSWQRGSRDVALVGSELATDEASEALLEAGALAVIDSPRRIGAVLAVAQKVALSRSALAKKSRAAEPIAEQAWAALPWQDA